MKRLCITSCLSMILTVTGGNALARDDGAAGSKDSLWRGVHLMTPGKDGIPVLKKGIEEGFKPLGINVIVLEVDYRFKFKSHPELSEESGLSRDDARDLAAFCRDRGIRLIPQFNCLGHQSWRRPRSAAPKVPAVRRDAQSPRRQQGDLLPELVPVES